MFIPGTIICLFLTFEACFKITSLQSDQTDSTKISQVSFPLSHSFAHTKALHQTDTWMMLKIKASPPVTVSMRVLFRHDLLSSLKIEGMHHQPCAARPFLTFISLLRSLCCPSMLTPWLSTSVLVRCTALVMLAVEPSSAAPTR